MCNDLLCVVLFLFPTGRKTSSYLLLVMTSLTCLNPFCCRSSFSSARVFFSPDVFAVFRYSFSSAFPGLALSWVDAQYFAMGELMSK